MPHLHQYPKAITEFEQNGKIIPYDACGGIDEKNNFERINDYYTALGYEHIGEGYVIYINGTKNTYKKLFHFYKRKTED